MLVHQVCELPSLLIGSSIRTGPELCVEVEITKNFGTADTVISK